jgi:hypothetical protein
VADGGIDAYEAALRRLPEAHSLALRLKRSGVADEVVCGYLHNDAEQDLHYVSAPRRRIE